LIEAELPKGSGARRILFIGAHDTMIPALLGSPMYNFVVFSVVTPPVAYMEKQWQYNRLVRQRWGQSFNRPSQGSYKDLPLFGGYQFPYTVVMPNVEFEKVRGYCEELSRWKIIAIQKWPCEFEGVTEKSRKYLKGTEAGYCIETDEENAVLVVAVLEMR